MNLPDNPTYPNKVEEQVDVDSTQVRKTRQVQEEISALVPIRQPLIIDMYLVQVEVAGTAVVKVSQI